MRSLYLPRSRSSVFRVLSAVIVGCLIAFPARVHGQEKVQAPDSLTNVEFWEFFKKMSEPDGYFLSENFVSNEVTFQDPIPTLQRSLTKSGVYLGVGPEQNFTYIANLQPRLAVIFDIRRQNAMQHLMYKALFELSPTRAEFLSRLFSRPAIARQDANIAVKALFDSAMAAPASDSAYQANLAAIIEQLTAKRGFALPAEDIASIKHVFHVFFTAGPEVNYGYRSGNPAFVRSTYPSYGMLQVLTNADSVQMAFLATEDHYHAVRRLQLKNLVVPVVADFGGPSGIRAVGQWLRNRSMTVTAFYVSNVEQYLFRDTGQSAERFYGNLTALPLDSTSMFIRSVPRMGMPVTTFSGGGTLVQGMQVTVSRDVNGYLITQSTRDSAGVQVTSTTIDSSRVRRDSLVQDTALINMLRAMRARVDSIARLNSSWQVGNGQVMQFMVGGTLTSGIAAMQLTLRAHFAGELKTYNSVIAMTKVSDWKR